MTLVTLVIVDYSGDCRLLWSEEDLPENAFRRRPAPDLGALDTSQPLQYSTLRVGDELLVRSNQAFRGEMIPRDLDLPKPSTHLMLLEKLLKLFPELKEGVEWDVREGGFRNVLDFLASIRVTEFTQQFDADNLPFTHDVNWNEFGRNYQNFRLQEVETDIFDVLDLPLDEDQVTCSQYSITVISSGTCRGTILVAPTSFCQSC